MDWRLVDTNIVSYLMKRNAFGRKYRPLLLGYKLVVSFQTVAELEEGMLRANWGTEKRSQFDRTLSTMKVIHSDDVIGSWWSQIRYTRRAQPIGVADAWIAATAKTFDIDLVTHNPKDFQNIPELRVITLAA